MALRPRQGHRQGSAPRRHCTGLRTGAGPPGPEETVFKRGRNAAVHAIPKNATTAQYHQATALECLLGWLYLRGDTARVSDLFDVMMEEN